MSVSNAKMSTAAPNTFKKGPRLLQYHGIDLDDSSLFEFDDLLPSPNTNLQQNYFGEYYALQDFEE